jgi:hypothetical protein
MGGISIPSALFLHFFYLKFCRKEDSELFRMSLLFVIMRCVTFATSTLPAEASGVLRGSETGMRL